MICVVQSEEPYLEMFHVEVLLEVLINHLKICGSHTNLQQFHNGFDQQHISFCQ
jgi:hypothetical protein